MLFNPVAVTEIRKIRGLSKSQLAKATNLSAPYITQLEGTENSRRTNPSSDALAKIAEALGVDDPRAFYLEPSAGELQKELGHALSRDEVAS